MCSVLHWPHVLSLLCWLVLIDTQPDVEKGLTCSRDFSQVAVKQINARQVAEVLGPYCSIGYPMCPCVCLLMPPDIPLL